MKITIIYFSGTGNTAWLVRQLAERLTGLGDDVTVASCEDIAASDVDPTACDVIGLAFPVHASFAPALFQDFLRDLPFGDDAPLFAVTTAGYAAGDTAWYAVQPLRDKRYVPFLMSNVNIANNLHLPVLSPIPVGRRETMPRKLERAGRKVNRLAMLIHRRESRADGADILGRTLGWMQRWGVERFEQFAFQGFAADETCTRCGWCVQHCPGGNIEMTDAGVQFSDHCMLCMRCYSFCPIQAIQSTDATRNVNKYRRYKGPEGKPRF